MKKIMLVFAICTFSMQLIAQTNGTKKAPPPPLPPTIIVEKIAPPPPPPPPPRPPKPPKVDVVKFTPPTIKEIPPPPPLPPRPPKAPKYHKGSKAKKSEVKFVPPVIVEDVKATS